MRELQITALMCSKVCHDLISPVGALSNGLEVLDDDTDEEMRRHAMELIGASVKQASAKLQFARLAFGAAGAIGDEISLTEAGEIASAYFKNAKSDLDWQVPAITAGKDSVKLLLNLTLLANDTIPRGGTIRVSFTPGEAAARAFHVEAAGPNASMPEGVEDLLKGTADVNDLDARAIQPFVTGLLARAANAELSVVKQDDRIVFTANIP